MYCGYITHILHFSRVQLFVTLWTVAHQAPLSMGFSRHEYWSGLPCPPSGDLPKPGIEPRSPTLQADSLPSEPPGNPKVAYKTAIRLPRKNRNIGTESNRTSRNVILTSRKL